MVFCNETKPAEVTCTVGVTILILIDGFLQYQYHLLKTDDYIVTILILIDGFLQYFKGEKMEFKILVTILILIDGFLQ